MTMKTLKLSAIVFAIVLSGAAFGQTETNAGISANNEKGDRIIKALELNEEQEAKFRVEVKTLRANLKANKAKIETIKAENKQLKADFDAKAKTILTEEQYAKFTAMKKEKKAKAGMKHKMGK